MPDQAPIAPIIGFQALRLFGASHPQLLDLSSSGEFWFPGWNHAYCPKSTEADHNLSACTCGYLAWNSIDLARQEHHHLFDPPDPLYPLPSALLPDPVLVRLEATGNIALDQRHSWRAEFSHITAIISDQVTAELQHLAELYQVPIIVPQEADQPSSPTISVSAYQRLNEPDFGLGEILSLCGTFVFALLIDLQLTDHWPLWTYIFPFLTLFPILLGLFLYRQQQEKGRQTNLAAKQDLHLPPPLAVPSPHPFTWISA